MQEKKIRIKTMIKEWLRQDYITPEDVPSIELYMDQVTTFMDKQLENTKRFDSDKTLTKTMINNYTKNNLLPSPEKKTVYEGTSDFTDLHLLFEKCNLNQ